MNARTPDLDQVDVGGPRPFLAVSDGGAREKASQQGRQHVQKVVDLVLLTLRDNFGHDFGLCFLPF